MSKKKKMPLGGLTVALTGRKHDSKCPGSTDILQRELRRTGGGFQYRCQPGGK